MLPLAASVLGTIPGWLTVIGICIASFLVWRGGGGTALGTLQTANQVLEKRVLELEKQGKADATRIAELTGKTDIALAMRPFMDWATQHELMANERAAKTLTVLALIAERLGPEQS